jgi:hypothetical protein
MGVPGSDMQPAEQPAADSLLTSFKTIDESGRARHAAVLDYWLSIRGDREFPPLHDLDPLKISDAGPASVLLELIGGGEDAEVRHLGESLKTGGAIERIADAPRPSILSTIAKKLSIVAISRNFLSFEDEFPAADGTTRCWVTLLPLNSAGPWVDYVYAFVTFETVPAEAEAEAETETEITAETPTDGEPETPTESVAPTEPPSNDVEESTAISPIDSPEAAEPADQAEDLAETAAASDEPAPAEFETAAPSEGPGFSEPLLNPANPDGFYGSTVKVEPNLPSAPAAAETSVQPASAPDGSLQERLAAVRAKAEEARLAKLRSNSALYEGLSAAYDFALDAEENAEEYLKMVEAQGLKIQLRSPMLPVMKLAFDGMCDEPTIARLEAVLAWALEQELPRGTLAERIEAAGGIARILELPAA